ncbi:MAG TPA: hypothetical protein VJ851_18000 [Jatrophihabitans sp.]|nr:hypothetical protein [Jatrophihabitans sp.]
MSAAVQLPTWAVYTAAVGPAIGAFLGVLFAQLVTRRGAKELEKRSRREQVIRTLQWAAELAVGDDDSKAELGIRQLNALAASDLSDDDMQTFIDAALDAVVAGVADEVEEDPEAEIEPVPDVVRDPSDELPVQSDSGSD